MNRQMVDLFAGGGGCSVGYARAGWDVTPVDIEAHDEHPNSVDMVIADALEVLADATFMDRFDAAHASPPCPRYSTATPAHTRAGHPDLISPVRDLLTRWGRPWVMENVPGAPLHNPITLCGSSFGLRVRRHRLFESNVPLLSLPCNHTRAAPVGVYGDHADRPGGWARPNGTSRGTKATSVADAQDALGIDWMTRWADLADAIPPDYTQFIGEQLLDHLARAAA